MKKIILTALTLVSLPLLFLTSCRAAPSSGRGGTHVLATTTILADIASNVAGERVTVESLLPVGTDPHAYQAIPSDAAKIAGSTILIQNGIEYEHFLETLLENAGGGRLIIIASDGLTPRGGDPHMWLDPNLVIAYVENIRDGLSQSDPQGAAVYSANAETYIAQLRELDAWIVRQVDAIPSERRLLVTNHEALGYFAERYGFKIVGTVIPSQSTGASTSAQGLAAVIDQIRSSGAPTIFLGEVENSDLADQIAAETGVQVVADLHLESLTDGAPAPTYIEMMKYNVTRIVEALR